MGNGRLDVGAGVGEANIWNPMVPVQNFNNLIQQKKLKQQAENDALAAELTKVRSDGLRNDADRANFFKKYEEIKNNAINGRTERDPMKRAMNKAQTKDELLRLQDYVSRSKQQGDMEKGLMTKINDPMQRHNYVDNSVQELIGNSKLAIDDPNYKKDLSILQRQVDHEKVDQAIKKMHQDALTKVAWSNPIQDGGKIKQGDKHGIITYQKRALAPDQILANDAHMYDVSDDLKQSLEQRYANIQGTNPAETKMLRVKQAAIDRGDIAVGPNGELLSKVTGEQNRKFNADYKPDNYYDHRMFMLNNPSGGNMQTPSQTLIVGDPNSGIQGMQQGGSGTGEKFINLAPAAQYGGKKPTIGVDKSTGEHLFNFPDILGGKDAANIKFNADLKKAYDKKPETKGGFLGMGADKVPFEKSSKFKELKPEIVVKRPSQVYRLNPASPDYAAQAAEMAKEQNINLSQLNQIEGKKGNKGQIQQVVGGKQPATPSAPKEYHVKGRAYKSSSVEKAAQASGMTVEEYLKEVNK